MGKSPTFIPEQLVKKKKRERYFLKQNYQEFATPEAAGKSTVTDWGQLTQTTLKHMPAAQGAGSSPCLRLAPTDTLVLVSVLLQDEQDQKADSTEK